MNRQRVENRAPISGGDCMRQNKKSVAHSIFQRLLNRACRLLSKRNAPPGKAGRDRLNSQWIDCERHRRSRCAIQGCQFHPETVLHKRSGLEGRSGDRQWGQQMRTGPGFYFACIVKRGHPEDEFGGIEPFECCRVQMPANS